MIQNLQKRDQTRKPSEFVDRALIELNERIEEATGNKVELGDIEGLERGRRRRRPIKIFEVLERGMTTQGRKLLQIDRRKEQIDER